MIGLLVTGPEFQAERREDARQGASWWEGGRGWGLWLCHSCSLSRWALLLQGEQYWPEEPMVVWRKQEETGKNRNERERDLYG